MSDGGKGSARRKENVQAVLNNWNLIFGKKPEDSIGTMEELEAFNKKREENGVRKDTPTVPKLPKQ
jgi:hypothetical protein